MKVLQINTVYGKGSTGKIAKSIHDLCQEEQISCITAYRYKEKSDCFTEDTMYTSSWLDCHVHNRLVRYTLLQGCFSYCRTKRFLQNVNRYKPDVIHLHNLHGSYINLGLLFKYIKKEKIRTIWTLHDCWAITGSCMYFLIGDCKWKQQCKMCPNFKKNHNAWFDTSKYMYNLKKKWFSGVQDMTIVTPSHWLADLVKQSFLKEYPIRVINNGIDLTTFKPVTSEFREKYNISPEKKVLLGVAMGWDERKGLDVFVELTRRLDPEKYQIVLVGTNEKNDKCLPENVISIHRTYNQRELAEIYSSADLFVNPTREDNFPTVNIEALACGTPVLTFRTGGSPEMLDESCGSVVACDDMDALEKEVVRICENDVFLPEACCKRAKCYDYHERLTEYIRLYKEFV